MASPKKPRIGRPPLDPEDRKKLVTFRLHPEAIANLATIAELRGENMSTVLTALISRELKRLSKK
jgi:hypothetical protein